MALFGSRFRFQAFFIQHSLQRIRGKCYSRMKQKMGLSDISPYNRTPIFLMRNAGILTMKSKARFIALLLLPFLFSFQARADDRTAAEVYFERSGLKLISGVANMATGWMELPKNIGLWRRKTDDELVGVTEGVLRGLVHTASRTASGALDLATFWLPTFPTPNPPFIWEDFSIESEYYAFRTGE